MRNEEFLKFYRFNEVHAHMQTQLHFLTKQLFFFSLSLPLCLQGYEYQMEPGKCCGKCVQKSCVFTTPDNTTHVIEVSTAAASLLTYCI